MNFRVLFIGAFAVSVAAANPNSQAPAAATSSVALTLDEAIRLAWERDPQVEALALAPQLAAARELQAGLGPNPQIELSSALPLDDQSEWMLGLSVSRQIPRRERLALARAYARIGGEAAPLELRARRRTLADEIRQLWYAAALQRAKVEFAERALAFQAELSRIISARREAGEIGEDEWHFSALELARAEQALAFARAEAAAARAPLHARLRLPESSPAPDLKLALGALLAAPQPSAKTLSENTPQLALAELEIRQAQAALNLARSESRGDWSIGTGVEFERRANDATGRLANEPRLTLSTSAPWPARQGRAPNRGTIAEREAALRIAEAQARALRDEWRAQARSALATAQALQPQVLRYQELCERSATELPQRLRALHERGELPLFALAQARQQQREIEAEFFSAAERYLNARAEVVRFTATDLAETDI
ncbi:hypothetical protein AXK11_07270 [Cephaloticoccus primus]|uniref:Transporter n=1 Tax=Cephaloticoccus primus TaxID=1548207 RepID=A0A139SKQ7_9BACT|nr:TolC family protein [Cephaloticoccus primus]KXU35143.1 hypothetical protein AXK11_07270 [Cephaloticoccus primus]